MPILATAANASVKGYGFLKSDLGGGYWLVELTTPSNNHVGYGVFTDALNNSYFLSKNYVSSTQQQATLTKMKPDGTKDWSQRLAVTTSNGIFGGGGADGSGNSYFGSYDNVGGGIGTAYQYIAKLNSSGSIVFEKRHNNNNDTLISGRVITVNPSGNGFAVGYTAPSGTGGSAGPSFTLFDSSGNPGLQRFYGQTGQNYGLRYMDNYSTVSFLASGQMLMNSSGTIVWGRDSSSDFFNPTAVNSLNEIYCCQNNGATGKINPSTGNIVWDERLTGMVSAETFAIAANSTYNYSMWMDSGKIIVAKRDNSTGALQWQRQITCSTIYFQIFSGYLNNCQAISVNEADTMVWISFYENSIPSRNFIFKLPADGSKTGSYTLSGATIVYSASTLTAAGYTGVRNAQTTTPQTTSLTTANNSAGVSSATTTLVKTVVP